LRFSHRSSRPPPPKHPALAFLVVLVGRPYAINICTVINQLVKNKTFLLVISRHILHDSFPSCRFLIIQFGQKGKKTFLPN